MTDLPFPNSSNTPRSTGSTGVENVFLRDEAHFNIELIEFAGRTVGARVFVTKTRRDLKITVEARNHQKLLELLRRLRQRVKLAGMQPRWHEKVARAFRRGSGENGRLEFEEALLFHPPPQAVDDAPAQHDIFMQLLAAKIEKAIFEPRIFGVDRVAEHGQWQFGGRPQHFDFGDVEFDQPRRAFRIFGAGRALAHFAVETRDPFGTQFLRLCEGRRIRIDHALRETVMIAQIDEQHSAMVANAVTPPGQPSFVAGVRFAKLSAAVRTITMHDVFLCSKKGKAGAQTRDWRGKAHSGGVPVKPRARLGPGLRGRWPQPALLYVFQTIALQ